MVIHNTQLNPQLIFLKSNEGILNNANKKSSVSFELKNIIQIPNNIDAYIQLNSFKFINSFYNINSSNNIFYYSISTTNINTINNLIIPIGNYNISTLLNYLNSQLSGIMNFIYTQSTFKITITATSGTMILRTGANNCLNVLGFENIDSINTSSLISTNLINLTGIQVLYLTLPNFSIASNSSKNTTINNILDAINIDVMAGVSQSFTSSTNTKYKVLDNSISKIDIEIYDEDNLLVDFNNADWYLSISFIFAYKMEYRQEKLLSDTNANIINNVEEEIIDNQDEIINNQDITQINNLEDFNQN